MQRYPFILAVALGCGVQASAPDDPQPSCGAGSHLESGACVSNLDKVCGPGTKVEGDSCVLVDGARYQVRTAASKVSANGYTPVPLFAIGTNGDGTPATGTMVWGLSRPGLGLLTPLSQTLTSFGASGSFIPCSSAVDAGCEGAFQVVLSRADQPQTPVASSAMIELVSPLDVYSAQPCQRGGNVLFFDGSSSDYIHPGMDSITMGSFTANATAGLLPSDIRIRVQPTDSKQGLWWDLTFSTRMINQPLRTQVYDGAERAAFAPPGNPGLDIGGDGRGCNTIKGRFQIQTLVMEGTAVKNFTASFEQFCDGRGPLNGCIHVEK